MYREYYAISKIWENQLWNRLSLPDFPDLSIVRTPYFKYISYEECTRHWTCFLQERLPSWEDGTWRASEYERGDAAPASQRCYTPWITIGHFNRAKAKKGPCRNVRFVHGRISTSACTCTPLPTFYFYLFILIFIRSVGRLCFAMHDWRCNAYPYGLLSNLFFCIYGYEHAFTLTC